jgi:hypothetical protein
MIVVAPRLLILDGSCHIALLYVMPVFVGKIEPGKI